MVKKNKNSKKISRKRPAKKEVDIPVFVVGRKKLEEVFSAQDQTEKLIGESLKIIRDEEDLPVFENSFFSDKKEIAGGEEREVAASFKETKKDSHLEKRPDSPVLKTSPKHVAPLSYRKKKFIMWGSVVVLVGAIFFIWLIGLKNTFSSLPGLASYTFVRSAGGFFEETEAKVSAFGASLGNLENAIIKEADEAVVDKMKEKILVDELKDKLEN